MKKLVCFLFLIFCPVILAACDTKKPSTNQNSTENIFSDDSKVIVVYFSATNNTESVAIKIQNEMDFDLYEILPEIPYSSDDLNYHNDSSRANKEQNDPTARPQIGSKTIENFEKYEYIFLGYPIWWGIAPKIIYTFLESYDFSGKTIIPFCTSGSSPVGSSATNLHTLASSATWLDGRRFSGSVSQSQIKTWIDGLNIQFQGKKEN